MARCAVCQGEWPHLEEHHVVPREYGGEDGPTRPLCGSCHGALHKEVHNRTSKNPEAASAFPPEYAGRAEPFVRMIIAAKLRYEALHPSQRTATRRLQVTLRDPNTLARLHKLKTDSGHTNLEKFLNDIFERLTRKYHL